MTVAAVAQSMEKNLEEFVKNSGEEPAYLEKAEEISLDGHAFEKNTISKDDWVNLRKQCQNLMAFSAIECQLEAVETPEVMKQIEVLDFSQNAISDLSFLKAFPGLVSLTIKDTKVSDLKQLDHLSVCEESFKVLEMSDDMLFGKASQKELRDAIFAKFPNLMGVNGIDSEDNELDHEFPEEDSFEVLCEEDGEEGEVEEGEEALDEVEEPEAKKQKTADA